MIEYNKKKKYINSKLEDYINDIKDDNLKEMVEWCLNGGKRLRAIIVLDICESQMKSNNKYNDIDDLELVLNISVACELLHNASLIIDDLPCMDNDIMRRGKETMHYKYGEKKAHLLFYYLMTEISHLLKKDIDKCDFITKEYKNQLIKLLLSNYLDNLNMAITGQFLDIYPLQDLKKNKQLKLVGNIKKEYIIKMIMNKTSPFFELSFISGYLLSNGDLNNLDKVRKVGQLFGLVFQISDDFEDEKKDLDRGLDMLMQNYVLLIGKNDSYRDFMEYIELLKTLLLELNLYSKLMEELINYLINRVKI